MRNKLYLAIIERQAAEQPNYTVKPITKDTGTSIPTASIKLISWLSNYYPSPIGAIASLFIPSDISIQRSVEEITEAKGTLFPPPRLTNEQQQKVSEILEQKGDKPILLHGDTGTGKTRVYIELTKHSLDAGKSALILTPEIGLTPQLTASFSSSFDTPLFVIHSKLTNKQRRTIWAQIASTDRPVIVIGARSALFSPVKNLGIVIVDEAHDSSYKQSQAPYYQSTRVAAALATIHKALCIFGTATPLVSDYYVFEQKKSPIIRMQVPAKNNVKAPNITIVDLKNRELFTKSRILSNSLISSVKKALSNREQALIFLNRRGTARVIICQNCGWQAICPNCDIGLTYHQDKHQLLCHICGIKKSVPTTCPDCSKADIIFQSIGTKAVVDELIRLFPDARIKRFDSDNLAAERLEKNFDGIVGGEVDVLVGTQVLSKGLDLPKLTVVGVLAADASLGIPDFTAGEQAYQSLTQVVGRVGRTNKPTSVIIQSYQPESPLLAAAARRDWDGFYKSQIKERKAFYFPPFCYLLQLTTTKSSSQKAEAAGKLLASSSVLDDAQLEVLGPSPCFHEKVRGKYSWQIVVKSKDRGKLIQIVKNLPSGWRYDIDPINLL